MIDAIYFPFTTISKPVLTALETCFQPICLLQPSEFATDAQLQEWSDQGRIRLRCAATQDSESLPVILKEYQNWAALHYKDGGLEAAYRQSLQGRPPLYDDSATSRIRSDIHSQMRPHADAGDRIDDPAAKLLRARLFLSVAHQFDTQETDLTDDLSALDQQEERLFAQLHGEADGRPNQAGDTALRYSEQRLVHMIPERMAAWNLIYTSCAQRWQNESVPVMITDSRLAIEHLVGSRSDTATLLNDSPLPANRPEDRPTGQWRTQWQTGLELLATSPWPQESRVFLPPVDTGDARNQWRLTVYLVPGLSPLTLLEEQHKDKALGVGAQPDQGRTCNTLVCLFARTV
jgi:hypothetical protein